MDAKTQNILQKFSKQKVELALMQDIIRDAEIAKQQVKALANLAARREMDFRKLEDIVDKVGVKIDPKAEEAGKFFRELESKLK